MQDAAVVLVNGLKIWTGESQRSGPDNGLHLVTFSKYLHLPASQLVPSLSEKDGCFCHNNGMGREREFNSSQSYHSCNPHFSSPSKPSLLNKQEIKLPSMYFGMIVEEAWNCPHKASRSWLFYWSIFKCYTNKAGIKRADGA